MTTLAPERATVRSGSDAPGDNDFDHFTCCDDDIGLCGLDLSGEEWEFVDDDGLLCPMCALMDEEGLPCPVPGCTGSREDEA